jgi:hypothetical protein
MAIMVVLQLPPMLSSRILVSLLSLSNTRQVYVTGYMKAMCHNKDQNTSHTELLGAGLTAKTLQQHNRNTDQSGLVAIR